MKCKLASHLWFLLLSFLASAFSVCYGQGAPITLLEVHNSEKGLHYSWRIELSALKDLPTWDGEGSPPLSVSDAVKIAKKAIQTPNDPGPHRLFSVCLRQPARIDPRVAVSAPVFYFVTFRSVDPAHLQEPYDVAVLLNGKVVVPLAEPIKK